MNPLLTAIVSTYRAERFIRGCLDDLESQTIADRTEIIVIDSASPENEGSVVREFQQRYSNIRYVRTEKREPLYAAWNRAIALANGKYLTSANTDDRHRRDAFETLVDVLERSRDAVLSYGDAAVTLHENETFESAEKFIFKRWLDHDPRRLFQVCYVGSQPVWRRDLHDKYGLFDDRLISAGDYEFWLRICKDQKFIHVSEVLGLYLASPSSIEHRNPGPAWKESNVARERYWPAEWGERRPRSGGLLLDVDVRYVLSRLVSGDVGALRDLLRFGFMILTARYSRGRSAVE